MDYIISQNRMTVPIIALRGLIPMPGVTIQFDVGRKKSVMAVDSAMKNDQLVFLTAQKDTFVDDPSFDDLYAVGTVSRIKQVIKMPGENMRVLAEGLYRACLVNESMEKPFFVGEVGELADDDAALTKTLALAYVRLLRAAFDEYIPYVPKMPTEVPMRVFSEENLSVLCDYIANNIQLPLNEKQAILSCQNVEERVNHLLRILHDEIEVCKIDNEIAEKLKEQIDKNQREYYMREQIKILQTELGEQDGNAAVAEEYRRKLEQLHVSDAVYAILEKEIDRLGKMPFGSHEAPVIRSYLDLCLELPYGVYTKDRKDIARARAILDKEHYGLDKVKERIIEFLAVHHAAPDFRGQILCLVGPPGVGKTSIAKSVAHALGRKFARMSLGGVRDEAEIRGHRRTYIGAMPGRVISAIKEAGSMNPVILLDEIDKLGADYKGDPSSALLEVLDPEQNKTFRDHFVDYDVDLSNVMFITTANTDDTIPPALLDRMDVLYLTSYTQQEKLHILKEHLLPKQMKKHALTKRQMEISDEAMECMISQYTREAGVRNLERQCAALCRKSVVKRQEGVKKVSITGKNLADFLGAPKTIRDALPSTDQIGIANGLAYTTVGGELLFVEVNVMEGTGKLELTGSLGDVMKESAQAALSYIRSRCDILGIPSDFYKTKDIHIHVPEGAVPKDGPSAGITIATALISQLTGRAIDRFVAMTGEITLRGRVLPIGGLKEKTMAAFKAGIRTVIIPAGNQCDIAELDEVIRHAIHFVPVEHMDDVLETALLPVKEDRKRVAVVQAPGTVAQESSAPPMMA